MSEHRDQYHHPVSQVTTEADGEYHIPQTLENIDSLSPTQRKRFGRGLKIGVAVAAASAVAAVGLAIGMNSHNSSAEGPAKGPRPAATGPEKPGPSTAEAAPVTYDKTNYPFHDANGKEVVGLNAFEKELVLQYDASKFDNLPAFNVNNEQDSQIPGAEDVVRQYIANMQLCAENSFTPPKGTDTYTSSSLSLEAFMSMVDQQSSLVDTSNTSDLAEWFYATSEGPLHQEKVTDTIDSIQINGTGSDERFTDSLHGLAITAGVILDQTTTASGSSPSTAKNYVQFTFTQERADANSPWTWKLTGFTNDGASGNPSLYNSNSNSSSSTPATPSN